MKVVLFGATGMIGQGALRECLLDPSVDSVVAVGRKPTGTRHAKLREVVHEDSFDYTAVEEELRDRDACLFCLGVSSAGMTEEDYRRVTYDIAMAAAATLCRVAPSATMIFVSGAGTDSSERGRSMWARIKGMTENALLALPFKASYMFRPGFIRPMHGIKSKTTLYRIIYAVLWPLYPLLMLLPKYVTTTERLGRAMLQAAKHGAPKAILESVDINDLATTSRQTT